MRSSSSAQTIIGTGLLSNSSRNEASRCFSSVMSTRRPIDAAVLGQPLLDQDAAAVGQRLLVACAGLIQPGEPLGDPLFLAADRFRIIAALDADADGVLQPCARLEQVGAAVVDLGVLLVPEDVAAVGIEKHDALRQDVDRLAQPLVGFSRIRDRGFRLGAHAHDLADLGRSAACAALWSFGLGFAGRPGMRVIAACLGFLAGFRPDTLHSLTPTRLLRPMFSDKCLKNW